MRTFEEILEEVQEKRLNERKFSLEVGDKYKAKKDVKLKGGVTLKGGVVYTIGSVDPDYIILRKINDKGKMLSNFPISWRDFNKNLDHHVVQENRLNEKTQKYDSEYVVQSAKVLAKDMGRSEPDLAWVFSTIHARVNQSYPGNQDISKKDVLDLIDPKMRRKYTDEINDALEMIFQ